MKIGSKEFDTAHHTYVMGILNVTPDSFSDGGRFDSLEKAKRQVEQMIIDGVDLIDVGGESTRPGHTVISDGEEIERILPAIEWIKSNYEVPVSVDTYKSVVASEAVMAGADLINDIWGLKHDPKMAALIASSGVACCLMHNRLDRQYKSFCHDVIEDLRESVRLADVAGIAHDKIILDPGVGFAKDDKMNLTVLRHLADFGQLGFPMLLAASRKSVIGHTLELPVSQREEGTMVTTVLAVMNHYSFVRVHDVKTNKRAIQMTEAIQQADPGE